MQKVLCDRDLVGNLIISHYLRTPVTPLSELTNKHMRCEAKGLGKGRYGRQIKKNNTKLDFSET